MASAVNFQAINFDHTDIKQALLAASATMVCESASEGILQHIKRALPEKGLDEPQSLYVQRCQDRAQDLAQQAVAGLRILTATGLALAGKDSGDIQVCDESVTTALEENFVKTVLSVAYDLAQGAKDVKENLEEGNYWGAAGHVALTAGAVGLDLASQGFGTGAVKAGVGFARKAMRGNAGKNSDKLPQALLKEGPCDPSKDPMPWTNKKTHTSPKTDPMPWENKGKCPIRKKVEEEQRQNRGLIYEKNAKKLENPGKTNLQRADYEKIQLKGQQPVNEVHSQFTQKVEKSMRDKEYKYKKELPDGRVRLYKKHKPAEDKTPNIRTDGGSNHVKELNPCTGNERNWTESYQKPNQERPKNPRGWAPQNDLHVIEVHPKPKKDGVEIQCQHYPATKKELEQFKSGQWPKLNTKPDILDKK
ncbi:hypothetical protein HE1_00031 [Holospora elegans E1]|uniref:Uncharacterized protein n=1 Tax=Holospora elegans E1 TaxID=1427503 RepID=A0A023DX17_9PROT|nr:hypothetical protein HE1_00031 [Holospora elegans E1]